MAAKKPPTRMQRSGNGHSYYLDGEKVPGVTTILGDGLPKPALVGWAANTTADYVVNRLRVVDGHVIADDLVDDLRAWNATRPGWAQVKIGGGELERLPLARILANVRYKDRDDAARRGTEVHLLAERLARGETVEVPEALRGHVDAYVRFLEEWRPRRALLERVVVNRKWRYMGKLDMIAEFPGMVWPDGSPVGRALLDVKTSRSGIFPEVGLQLEGYRNAETMLEGSGEIPMPAVDWVGAIHVTGEGYEVRRLHTTPETFRVFLYAKQLADWLAKDGPASQMVSDALDVPRSAS